MKKFLYLVIFFLIAFILPLICVLIQINCENNVICFILYGIEALSPSIAGIVVLLLEHRLKEFFKARFHLRHLAISFALPVFIAAITMLIAKALAYQINGEPFNFISLGAKKWVIICFSLIAEEIGWRGYLAPELKKYLKYDEVSTLAVGIIWAMWHYHFFILNGIDVPITAFIAGCIIESYIYLILLKHSDNNMISASMYHFSFNLFINLFGVSCIYTYTPYAYVYMVVVEAIFVLMYYIIRAIIKRKQNNMIE